MKFSNRKLSDGFSYLWMAPLGELMLLVFFRKIHLSNIQKVPANRPILLAVNHPTAFTDPIFLCIYLEPPIYNMTRGDIFQKPLFRKLLSEINMFPVFRQRDGYHDRSRNDDVFDFCFQKLKEKKVITIYVEGEHHLDKRVRPLQKGIARIAFGAMEKEHLTDLCIIPVGVNYQVGDQFRDEAMINIGDSIPVLPFFEKYKIAPGQGMVDLMKTIRIGLEKVCFHIENPEDDALAEYLLSLHRSEHKRPLLPIKIRDDERFASEKEILNQLNRQTEPEKKLLFEKTSTYFEALRTAGLEDWALLQPSWGRWYKLLFFIATFPLFLLGYITSRPIAWAVQWALLRVKKREFISSVMLGVGHLTGIFYYGILLIISLLTFDFRYIVVWAMIFISGFFYVIYLDFWKKWRAARNASSSPHRLRLLALRKQIFQ